MNEVEEKKVEVPRIDPLFFVVRELDSIKGTTREEFDKVYKEFDKVYAALDEIKKSTKDEFDKVYAALDEIKKSTKDEFDKVYAALDEIKKSTKDEFDKVYGRFNRVEDKFHELKAFTVRVVFAMAGLIIAGVGILFQLMR